MRDVMNPQEIEKKLKKDPILQKLSAFSKDKDIPIFLVGGYLRDILITNSDLCSPKDYDLVLPKEASDSIPLIEKILNIHFFKIGKEERDTLIYRFIKEDLSIDLAFIQGASIEEDLRRRDFTINAIAFSLRDKTLHWIEGALEDIEKRLIRPSSKFSIDYDPLRMLRAIRYLCTLEGFSFDHDLEKEINKKKELIETVAKERIKMELDHILLSPRPELGMDVLYRLGLLLFIIPELKGLEMIDNDPTINVLSHSLLTIKKITSAHQWFEANGKKIVLSQDEKLSLYWASLFHDLGKQDTYSKDDSGRIHFYHHETYSCERAERIMERLRFSNQMKEKILRLIKNHMRILNLPRNVKENAMKRLVNNLGQDTPLLLIMTMADREASRAQMNIELEDCVETNCLRIINLFYQKDIIQPQRLITGHDVMALGYPSGPMIGEILKNIYEKQIEGRIKTRDEALDYLKKRFRPKD